MALNILGESDFDADGSLNANYYNKNVLVYISMSTCSACRIKESEVIKIKNTFRSYLLCGKIDLHDSNNRWENIIYDIYPDLKHVPSFLLYTKNGDKIIINSNNLEKEIIKYLHI